MKKKIKWNYAIVKSIFGDCWIGKTKLKADEIRIFTDIEDVIKLTEEEFLNNHFDFEPNLDEEDEDYDDELAREFSEIRYPSEEAEQINKGLEKFIVKL